MNTPILKKKKVYNTKNKKNLLEIIKKEIEIIKDKEKPIEQNKNVEQ